MDPYQWNIIEPILDEALERPANEQKAYIRSVCGNDSSLAKEIIALLESIKTSDETDFLEKVSVENKALIQDIYKERCTSSLMGRRIGVFKIIEKIGHGGMGQVFKAERADGQFEQKVAIKVVRNEFQSKEILERFKIEKQVLAKLSHPNIAKIFDGGVTSDGHPYLIMEFIAGMPIDEYCDEKKLSITQRLHLFKKVCRAVEYAHQNLIIHRDLKAQNIYVTTEGVIKILDFGIAKLLDTELSTAELIKTQPGTLCWTPHYAAPEQVENDDISTATDVYALGVLLYKLLADSYPFNFTGKTLTEVRTIITTKLPNPLSGALEKNDSIQQVADQRRISEKKLRKKTRGDLGAIAAKAIHRSVALRYASVTKLADDIDNYKNGLPVTAQKPSFSYQFKKYVVRHKVPLAVVSGIILMVVAFALFYTIQITKERDYARQEAQKAEQLTVFLMDLFKASKPSENKGKTVTAGELLNRAEKRANMLRTQPAIQAQMFDVIGRIYRRLGEYKKSRKLLKQAVSIRKSNFGAKHLETLASMDHLGLLLTETGAYRAAETLFRKILAIRHTFLKPKHLSIAITQSNLAYVLRREGHYKKAETLYRTSIQTQKNLLGATNPLTIETLSSLGTTLHYQGNYEATVKIFRQVLQQRRKALGPIHPKLAQSINNLGAVLMNAGQFKEAESLFRESLTMRQTLYGKSHPKVALMLNNMGIVLYNQRKYTVSGGFFERALALRKNLFGSHSISTGITLFSLGHLMLKSNRPDSALTLLKKAHTIFNHKLSDSHSLTVRSFMGIGSAYLGLAQYNKAGKHLQAGFRKIQYIHEPNSLEYALAERQFGAYLLKRGYLGRANTLFTHALESLQTIEGKHSLRQKSLQMFIKKVHSMQHSITVMSK